MNRYLILLITGTMMMVKVNAQVEGVRPGQGPSETIFHQETEKSYTLMHIAGPFDQKQHTNAIIIRMGEFYGLNPANSYRNTFKYMQKSQINRIGSELELKVSLSSAGFTTRPNTRTFDFSPYLTPDRMTFKLQLLDGSNNVLYEQEFPDVAVGGLQKQGIPVEIVSLKIQDSYPGPGLSLRVAEVVSPQPKLLFYHTQGKHQELSAFAAHIKSYEEYSRQLAANITRIKAFRFDDPDKLSSLLDELEGYKSFTDEIIQENFPKKLNLKESDPEKLVSRLEEFATLYQETKRNLQDMLRSLDEVYYNKGMAQIAKNDLVNALVWFNKSLDFNPDHLKSNYQVAFIDMQQGRLEQAKTRADRILNQLNPDRQTASETQKLLNTIHEKLSVQKTETYRNIISGAEKEWMKGNLPVGMQKLDEAARFQADNSAYIPNNGDVMLVFKRFVDMLSSDAEKSVKLGRYEQGIRQYEDVLQFCRQHSGNLLSFNYIEEKINEVHALVMDNLLQRSKTAMVRGDFVKAEEELGELIGYLNRYPGIPEPPALQGVLTQVQRGMFSTAESMLATRSYPQAFELLNRCMMFSQRFGLQQPQQIYRMMEDARNGVFVSLLMSGQQSMNSRDFTGAEYYLNEALHFMQNKISMESSTALDAYKDNLMSLYLTEAGRQMDNRQYEKAIEVYERAQHSQYTYGIQSSEDLQGLIGEAHQGIALRMLEEVQPFLDKKLYSQALESLKRSSNYIEEHYLAGQAQGQLTITADRYFRDILQEADRLNRAKSYTEALSYLTDAWYVCKNYPIRCDENLVVIREKESRTGIHKSIVAEAQKIFDKGDYAGARKKIGEAEQYRKAWPDYVTSLRDEELLMGKIRQKEYQSAVTSGKAFLDRKEYSQALGWFDEAWNLEGLGGFTGDSKLKDYRKTAALKVILAEADQLEGMITQGNLMGSKDKLLQIMTMRSKYNLQDQKEVDNRLQVLQNRMVSAACRQQQAEHDQHMDQAYNAALKHDFILAGTEIRKAIEAAGKLPECNISDSSAVKYLVQLTPAILYQEKSAEARKLMDQYKNTEALKAYLEAEDLFNRGNVKAYGLDHEPFTSYVLHQNLNFILAAAFHYKEQGNPTEAMHMLRELASKGYPADQTRLLQEQIGYQTGRDDRLKNPGSKWKTAVLVHTGGNKFWKYFKTAYGKGWKSVK